MIPVRGNNSHNCQKCAYTGVVSLTFNAAAWSCRSLILGNRGRRGGTRGALPLGYESGRVTRPLGSMSFPMSFPTE